MPKYLYAENVTEEESSELRSFKRQGAAELVRGRIIELSASGRHPEEISESVDLSIGRVRDWIRHFNKERLPGLAAKKSPGRPRKFPDIRYQVRAIISHASSEHGIPKSRWTLADICRMAVELGLLDCVTLDSFRRFSRGHPIRNRETLTLATLFSFSESSCRMQSLRIWHVCPCTHM
jgi:transposase